MSGLEIVNLKFGFVWGVGLVLLRGILFLKEIFLLSFFFFFFGGGGLRVVL